MPKRRRQAQDIAMPRKRPSSTDRPAATVKQDKDESKDRKVIGDDAKAAAAADVEGGKAVRSDESDGACSTDNDDDDDDDDEGDVNGMRSAVKIFVARTRVNELMPWQVRVQQSTTGSGCLLAGRRILTNAHVVHQASLVSVLKHGDPRRYLARVDHVGHEFDLALLSVVEDPDDFWAGSAMLEIGEVPSLQAPIIVVGYPTDVDSLSVTEGVVSRVLVEPYRQSRLSMLKIQVDAAINPGNSGGPAIGKNGRLVGVAFEGQTTDGGEMVQNIGFLIPPTVIRHFLEQLKRHGRVLGVCELGLSAVRCENPSLRSYLQLKADEHGVMVRHIKPLSVCAKSIEPDDALLAIDGEPVADDGTVAFRRPSSKSMSRGERVAYQHVISMKHAGDTCRLTVKRAGRRLDVDVILQPVESRLVPTVPALNQPAGRYLVWAGLVLIACSEAYMEAAYEDGAHDEDVPIGLRERCLRGEKNAPGAELVVLSQVLSDGLTRGYTDLVDRVVVRLNGETVQNLAHVEATLAKIDPNTHPFVRLDLDSNDVVVLDTRRALDAHPLILNRNHIPPAHPA